MAAVRSSVRILPRAGIGAHPLSSRSSSRLRMRQQPQQRTFFSPPTSEPQTLTASARLPYNHAALYDQIADIDSYVTFLPYCRSARVTAWSAPDADPEWRGRRRWPTRADLTAGWGGIEATYTSRVFCAPGIGVVEAISGDARTELSEAELRRYGLRDDGPDPRGDDGGVFKSLVTRWTVTPAEDAARADRFQNEWSDVRLDIKFRFENPLYGAVSSAVADKLAPVMVNAFVEQAKRVLKEPRKS
ncbi:hypothetical protein DL766_007657 [Monosporascus sp. MC13-8B]|uniref:Coenzyme Q-binding protein COQ10 START domain-containing protein n=1 Tax=Monosporascus cannonballus TaxID=155416 RepID=A0ABY0HCJ7_9PEZI|nr:hypothetical protein DL763_007481 [Monosporascus cannonballus]RYO87335.1 hypothetical protein DL762_004265 [Monosporascus cannonballus]RYP22733.1 hypothetical protein DL766_007657 [Monosporascus sp. MC13-8B]